MTPIKILAPSLSLITGFDDIIEGLEYVGKYLGEVLQIHCHVVSFCLSC